MGDDSSTKLNTSNTHEFCNVTTHPSIHDSTDTDDSTTTRQHFKVTYTHKKTNETQVKDGDHAIECTTFDELLDLLELDLVETLWFDETVNQQERTYITGWAKIFRPDLKPQILPTQKQLH